MKRGILLVLLLFLAACAPGVHDVVFSERGGGGVGCSEPVIFKTPPVNLDKVGWIVPLGAMNGNHVTPTDHQYYQANHLELIEVTSPGDGVVTLIERMVDGRDDDWRIIIRHTCSVESVYIHIDKLSDKLFEHVPVNRRTSSPRVKVFEGEILGWYDRNVDYNVVDYDIEINLINKESFSRAEPWKIHVQDPFLYFEKGIQERLISLSQRVEPPFGGRIDYDVDGALIGMWFEEGTNGYAGEDFKKDPYDYHKGHLAIAPNPVDPSYTHVSVGTYNDGSEGYQFGVGNVDASKIIVGEKVTWTLYDFDYFVGGVRQHRWGVPRGATVANTQEVGSVTFELVEKRRLRADFGDGMRYYVR